MSDFLFKNLTVWQKALVFADKIIEICENLNSDYKHYKLIEQTEAASSSIAQNIAEGSGRHSKKEFIQFIYYSRGSLYETITLLNLFEKRNWITNQKLEECEQNGIELGKMLNGLINSLSKAIE
ncbi:four helix bundle protein [Carboxylicivirga caseinilyticus]|uniref:four helix bundle protein n=1 Tax=Carboxylicivirga caseinilyticus TaxID=3417572 RepID=UPI003D3302D4|nr:four helix bundle protein [Marinilabiliaceae bacterium A049]